MIAKKFRLAIPLVLLLIILPLVAVNPVKATTNYQYTIVGPYYYDGGVANTVAGVAALYVNNSIYRFTLTGNGVSAQTVVINSINPITQILWNASSSLNFTSVIDFQPTVTSYNIKLYIPSPLNPTYIYEFPVTDFFGMTHPYLQIALSTDGTTFNLLQQVDLTSVGTPSFVLAQFGTYQLTFLCDQGSYSQQFVAENVFVNNLQVLNGYFPANSTNLQVASATRTNQTSLLVTYYNPNSTTSWFTITVDHYSGSTFIVDYTGNFTSNNFSLTLTTLTSVDYYVQVQDSINGTISNYPFSCPAPLVTTNPFTGLLDFLGTWPTGLDPAQLLGSGIILICLGIGSYGSKGFSCIFALLVGAILAIMGWYTMSATTFAFAFFLGIIIAIQEAKESARDA